MRYIDDIIHAVKEHPGIAPIHKQVIIDRIEKPPTHEELEVAAAKVMEGGKVSG